MKYFPKALTKADKLVIRVLVCVIIVSVAVALLSACTRDDSSETTASGVSVAILPPEPMEQPVTITFGYGYDIQPMTRSDLATAGMTRLDVWIYEAHTEVAAVHQTSSDVGFGSVSQNLNKTKTYTLYALAHKATEACTLEDGVITFPDDKPKESFFYSTTFSPASTTAINAEMSRITGKFTLQTTDVVPDDVDHMRFVIAQTGTRYNVATAAPANVIDRTVDFTTISRKNDGTCSFAFQILSTSDAATNFDITATAYSATNKIIETKTFPAVPIRNNYRTTYSGAFFTTSAMSMSFTASDWNDFDTINF